MYCAGLPFLSLRLSGLSFLLVISLSYAILYNTSAMVSSYIVVSSIELEEKQLVIFLRCKSREHSYNGLGLWCVASVCMLVRMVEVSHVNGC